MSRLMRLDYLYSSLHPHHPDHPEARLQPAGGPRGRSLALSSQTQSQHHLHLSALHQIYGRLLAWRGTVQVPAYHGARIRWIPVHQGLVLLLLTRSQRRELPAIERRDVINQLAPHTDPGPSDSGANQKFMTLALVWFTTISILHPYPDSLNSDRYTDPSLPWHGYCFVCSEYIEIYWDFLLESLRFKYS